MKTLYLLLVGIALASCGTMQSIVKSSFPYTTTLVIPTTSEAGKEYSAINTATSFDQSFVRGGNNADKVNAVRMVSAKLQATSPTDYNIGRIASVKIFMSKADGSGEVMVASRTDIGANVGNSLVLDIDNAHFLDELVRQPSIRVRMAYKLRDRVSTDVSFHVAMSVTAYPNKQ